MVRMPLRTVLSGSAGSERGKQWPLCQVQTRPERAWGANDLQDPFVERLNHFSKLQPEMKLQTQDRAWGCSRKKGHAQGPVCIMAWQGWPERVIAILLGIGKWSILIAKFMVKKKKTASPPQPASCLYYGSLNCISTQHYVRDYPKPSRNVLHQ